MKFGKHVAGTTLEPPVGGGGQDFDHGPTLAPEKFALWGISDCQVGKYEVSFRNLEATQIRKTQVIKNIQKVITFPTGEYTILL